MTTTPEPTIPPFNIEPPQCGFTPRECHPGELLDAALDQAYGNGTSPWFWLAVGALVVFAILAVGALVVFRPRLRAVVTAATDPATLWRKHLVELSKENRQRLKIGLPLIPEPTGANLTFTPVTADTLPPAPVNLDTEGR